MKESKKTNGRIRRILAAMLCSVLFLAVTACSLEGRGAAQAQAEDPGQLSEAEESPREGANPADSQEQDGSALDGQDQTGSALDGQGQYGSEEVQVVTLQAGQTQDGQAQDGSVSNGQALDESGQSEQVPENAIGDGQQIIMENGVYSWISYDKYCTLFYAVRIHNPNSEHAVMYPRIQVTARTENNAILKTEERILPAIAADDTIYYADMIYYEGEAPASVNMTASNDDRCYILQEGSGVLKQEELAVSNVSENVGENSVAFTGEIMNKSSLNQDRIIAVVIFKRGDDIIGGISKNIGSVRSGETKPFEVDGYSNIPEHDYFEIYALQG